MKRALAVVISDQHYSRSTWQIADQGFRAAIDKAAELKVPVIDCGDLSNDKAMLNAEYLNPLVKTLSYAGERGVFVYTLIGNHSLMHEKGDDHALHCLKTYCTVVSHSTRISGFNFIPYQTNASDFYKAIEQFPRRSIVFAHQGNKGGDAGHYFQDPSAVDVTALTDWRVFAGHYHSHYTVGNWTSIGNPYSLTFGEAKDGPKGFLVVYSDGSFERVILPLRKHVVLECAIQDLKHYMPLSPDTLLWAKITGPYTELKKLNKREIGQQLLGHGNYKLNLIPTDTPALDHKSKTFTESELMDRVIDSTGESAEQKKVLKALWREIV